MSAPRSGRWQKATALVPLAALSAAWTVSLAGAGATTPAAASQEQVAALPDGSQVPAQAIENPASVSAPGVVAPGVEGSSTREVVSTASPSGIPAAALAAYQRAETVINAADRSCHLPWQLIAAIGRVESDHGRYGGNALDADGVARPGIFGIALDGSHGTSRIVDSDDGLLDGDTRFDRAVGPMQFIPSTWRVVGVDADQDGKRDPQDIDDAALATAVYLCSGSDDLGTDAGSRAAVYRYNHSHSYVDLVISIAEAYLAGDYTSVPNGVTTSTGVFVPEPAQQAHGGRHHGAQGGHHGGQGDGASSSTGGGGSGSGGGSGGSTGGGGGGGDTGGNGGNGGNGGGDGGAVTLPPLPDTSVPPVDDVLTSSEALAQCLADGVVDNPLTSVNELTQCVNDLLNP
ncbi:lytic murein transglycosylase [Nocardioides taihuensis]|uniref:Lytic murein transglycosylase n=1 Tax=Nocardioides taihuensis TaxID=1835606 RepID=A0ABW0BHH2_9ACTN